MKSSYTPKKCRTRLASDVGWTDGHLAGLLKQASGFQHLNRLLAPLLGPDVAAQVRVACLREGELVILANSPAWANRVRMAAFRLLTQLKHRLGDDIRSIRVKVEPLKQPPAAAILRHPLSDSARQCLRQFAESSDDPKLAEIARQLSSFQGR